MKNLIKLKDFAHAINVSEKLAYGMARSTEFQKHKISLDISCKSRTRKNALWRIDIDKYYSALEKGLI